MRLFAVFKKPVLPTVEELSDPDEGLTEEEKADIVSLSTFQPLNCVASLLTFATGEKTTMEARPQNHPMGTFPDVMPSQPS